MTIFFFFPPDFFLVGGGGYLIPGIWDIHLGLKRSKTSGEKQKQKQKTLCQRLVGRGSKNTCAIFSVSGSKKRHELLDFCAQNMCNRCSYVVPGSFSMGVICDLIMALGSQIFETLRKKQCRHALEYTSYRLGLKKWRGNVVFLRKRLTMVDLFEGLWSVGTRCRH